MKMLRNIFSIAYIALFFYFVLASILLFVTEGSRSVNFFIVSLIIGILGVLFYTVGKRCTARLWK